MVQKTFTEKIIDVLINGDMPTAKGAKATETGLIILTSKMTAPVCASYGSSHDMVDVLTNVLERDEPIRCVIIEAVLRYTKSRIDDPQVDGVRS